MAPTEVNSRPFTDPRDNIVAAVLDVLASVDKAALARRADPARGIELLGTRVDPNHRRRLADLVEEALPGAIDEVRDAGQGSVRTR